MSPNLLTARRKGARTALERLISTLGTTEVISILADVVLALRERMRGADPNDRALELVGAEIAFVLAVHRLLEARQNSVPLGRR